ncbi:MAG: RecX family transcriptional regulator [Ignavibacteriales bacterium]|nr:RecX family transcriptional regulator [Ignavibacteriales bacterium]
MVISSLEKQKKSNRLNLCIDGDFILGISAEVAVQFQLHVGKIMTEKELLQIREREEFLQGYTSALRILSRSLRSEKELRERLRKKKIPASVLDSIIQRLYESRFLDDENYAAAFVSDSLRKKKTGKRLLQQQLRAKGIAKEVIVKMISPISVSEERKRAELLAQKKLAQYVTSSRKRMTEQKKKSLNDYLLRRGFSPEITVFVLRKIFADIAPSDYTE